MRVKVKRMRDAMHPSEVVVLIHTVDGDEKIVVDKKAIEKRDSLEIGWPLKQQGSSVLIELPRETQTGSWRVWVPQDELEPDPSMVAA